MVMVFAMLALLVLVGFCSLAVDYGRVQTAKTELQRTADAAARAAVAKISTSVASAQTAATSVAASNTADGAAVVLATEDIEFGTWNSTNRTFTVLSGAARSSANSIRVTARRNDVPLYFATAVGMSTIDVSAIGIASITPNSTSSPIGFVALNEMDFKKETFIGSYKSSENTNPDEDDSTGNAQLSTNGNIKFHKDSTLDGDALLGPSGSLDTSNLTMTGTTTSQAGSVTASASPTWSPTANPGGVPQNYTVSSTTTLGGGTYWFTSFKVNKPLTFSGPATIYVNGDIDLNDPVNTHQSLPANLKIYQIGSNRKLDLSKEVSLTAQVHAPGSDMKVKKECIIKGSLIVKTLNADKEGKFFVDEDCTASGSSSSSGGVVCLVE